jgi:uracil-DNA glycosylase
VEPPDERPAIRDRDELRRSLAACRRCPAAGIPVESLPVFNAPDRPLATLVGQAPGVREQASRRPFAGDAGNRLRRWLEPAGLGTPEAFYRDLQVTSVAKCFPGKRRGGSDLPPGPAMRRQCLPWLERELALWPTAFVISVGAMALAVLQPQATLADVGRELELADGRPLIALPHPSGASPWPHLPGNAARLDDALGLIAERLRQARGRAAPGGRG